MNIKLTIIYLTIILLGVSVYTGFSHWERVEIKKQESELMKLQIEYVKCKTDYLEYQDKIQKKKVILLN